MAFESECRRRKGYTMSKKGHSEPGLFGGYNHYDEYGRKTGHSTPGLFGGYDNYDSHGHKTGHSEPGLFGGYNTYDEHGHKTGHSEPGLFGGYDHYDAHGNKIGHSDPGLFGGYEHSEGCYIATCVYGSYDCPEVRTLRRFRDECLAKTWHGRAFIRVYYAISPTVVRLFGKTKAFQSFWRCKLDAFVLRLKKKGYKDTGYTDCGRH